MTASPAGASATTTFDELLRPLQEPLAQHARDHPPHYLEKLHFADFVRLLIYYFTAGCQSGRLLLTDLDSAVPELNLRPVKRATFFDAFQRFPVAWWAQLFTFVLEAVTWQAIPELAALGKLYCVDGSIFPAIATMLGAQFLVADGNSNEKRALIKMLAADVTYIADRGYFAFYLPQAIVEAGAFFVIRAPRTFSREPTENLSVAVPATIRHIFSHITDQLVRLPNATGQPLYRLVSFQVGAEY